MRRLPKSIIIISILTVAMLTILYYQTKLPVSETGTITLSNLPDQFCPTSAQVVVLGSGDERTVSAAMIVPVDSCRKLTISSFVDSSEIPGDLFVKLPLSLARKIRIESVKANYQFSVNFGDINNDNRIDNADEDLALNFIKNPASNDSDLADLNRDSRIDVIDLSIIKRNHGVGTPYPTKGDWTYGK